MYRKLFLYLGQRKYFYDVDILKSNVQSKYKRIVCTLKKYNLNSREKFKHGQGFELWTSRAQVVEHMARDLVQIPVHPAS